MKEMIFDNEKRIGRLFHAYMNGVDTSQIREFITLLQFVNDYLSEL